MATVCTCHIEDGLEVQNLVEHACTATSGEVSASPQLQTDCSSPRGSESLAEYSKNESVLLVAAQGSSSMSSEYYTGSGLLEENPEPVLSIRMLMTSKDVGSIIGKGGMTIKAFRESSGARINISNSTSSERLVQITGNKESITKAFSAIGIKILRDSVMQPAENLEGGKASEEEENESQVSFRLVIQSSQCGSLIGKGGSRIKEIRESTGASIQVAGETLPNSTERAVTVSGSPDALTLCIGQICNIMLENPPRGPNIPYKPHTLPNQAYQPRPNLPYQTPYTATFHTAAGPATTSQQMRIPNDLIGCVIGRKGSKIHEIRVSSGAQIKIAGNEGDSQDRLVTITGTPEAVGVAQYLINSRIHSEVNSFISVGMTL